MMNNIYRILQSRFGMDYLAVLIVLVAVVWTNVYYKFWKDQHRIIVQDVILYYEYLPSAFIYKDLTMSFTKSDPEFFQEKIWKIPTGNGKAVSKMTMGIAVIYSPFFMVAHWLAKPLGYQADGYTTPYRIALIVSSIFYSFLGLIFLMKLLRNYFDRKETAITIVALGIGTNLYFYTTIEPTMSHAYSFFLFSVFIYYIDKWVKEANWLNTILLGLTGGLIILVRPSNVVIFILLLLWGVESFSDLKTRGMLMFRKYNLMTVMIIVIILVFLPQLLYWKYNTGKYLFYGYGEEGFFFNDPAFLRGMFSYRKGWLVYTPIMGFALLGIISLYFREKQFFWAVFSFTIINLYIVWSWWCWWYGGGFGQRALIESYAILALPFASFTRFILKQKIVVKTVYLFLIVALIYLNMFQTRQYYIGIIHWDSMSKYNYWDSFFRTRIPPNFYNHLEEPDYQAALKGDR